VVEVGVAYDHRVDAGGVEPEGGVVPRLGLALVGAAVEEQPVALVGEQVCR